MYVHGGKFVVAGYGLKDWEMLCCSHCRVLLLANRKMIHENDVTVDLSNNSL